MSPRARDERRRHRLSRPRRFGRACRAQNGPCGIDEVIKNYDFFPLDVSDDLGIDAVLLAIVHQGQIEFEPGCEKPRALDPPGIGGDYDLVSLYLAFECIAQNDSTERDDPPEYRKIPESGRHADQL